jgi:hypothetical protein
MRGVATTARSKNYTVTRTFGPYNGAAKIGWSGSYRTAGLWPSTAESGSP